MADAEPLPPIEPAPLSITGVSRVEDVDDALIFSFSRGVSDGELELMGQLPPSPVVAREARHFAERVILAELAVRLFRTLVLGNIIIEESPAAMDWLRDWIDGTFEGHGPMGSGPMLWPEKLTIVAGMLRQWGFQPTPTLPAYVTRQPAKRGVPTRTPGRSS